MRVGAWLRIALLAPLYFPLGAQQREPGGRASADTAEPVLLDIRIERAASITVQAYRDGDRALIPLADFLTLAEIRFTLVPDGGIEGVLQPEGVPFAMRGDTATVGARRIPVAPQQRLVRDGQLYLDTDRIGAMFGLTFVVEWSDLMVSVNEGGVLPVVRRIQRDQARAVLLAQTRQQSRSFQGVPLGMLRPPLDGAVLDYTATIPNKRSLCGGAAAVAFGANLLGGSLEATATSGSSDTCARSVDGQVGWTGVWLHNPRVRQLRIGEAITTGPSPRQIRGFSVSNTPFIREPEFGVGRYLGMVGRGWEIEAYRSGALVSVDTADSTGRFDIRFPISYGDNPVDFYAYGPHGEERRFGQSYRVVYDLVPVGTFEYGASAGRCPSRLTCKGTGNVDMRYGVSPKWTLRGGYDRFVRDSLPDLGHPYARVTGLFTNALSLDVRAVLRAALAAELAYQPTVDRRIDLSFALFDTSVVQPLIAPSGVRSELRLTGFYRPSTTSTRYFVQWDLERQDRLTSIVHVAQVTPSIQTTNTRYAPRFRIERVAPAGAATSTRAVAGVGTFSLFPSSWGPLWSRLAGSTNYDFDAGTGRTIQAGASLIARLRGNGLLLTAGVSYAPGAATITTMSLQANGRTVRGFTQAVAQRDRMTALQTVQGSVVWNQHAREARFISGPSLQRSGVAGRVYLDANANGLFDAGDQPLSGVFVRAAASGALTDSLGRYAVWDIPTFTPTTIAVDSATLESPLWIPATPALLIEPGPNHYRPIDIAILPGGSIDGRVVRASGPDRLGLPGVQVTLANVRTGARTRTDTFIDGGFSFLGVRPGEYDLLLDDRVVTRFAGTFTPRRVVIAAERDGAVVTDVELAIVTAPPVAVAIDLAPAAPVDSDGDGVIDPDDRCPGTPRGMRVDVVGCPVLFGPTDRAVVLQGVNFRTGSAILTRPSLVVLDSVARILVALPTVKIEIGGHTDNVGGATMNLRLSQARARSVMRYLNQRGVPLSRMAAVGYGPRIPVAPNTTAAGRARNRRVEMRKVE